MTTTYTVSSVGDGHSPSVTIDTFREGGEYLYKHHENQEASHLAAANDTKRDQAHTATGGPEGTALSVFSGGD